MFVLLSSSRVIALDSVFWRTFAFYNKTLTPAMLAFACKLMPLHLVGLDGVISLCSL
jgi:hypothetical protein